jgi:Pvc16 N-terminal domain
MSSEHAIITVTRALRQILSTYIPQTMGLSSGDVQQAFEVVTLPPHRVRDLKQVENLINLFLYRTDVNAAWRNMPLPSQAKPGESAPPPLALNLEYMISAYGEREQEDIAHFFLGEAMRVLHDCTIVPRAALANEVEGKGRVHEQIENVRVTPLPLSVEEMSKLWSTFQTGYRVSAAYLVTVLLIDSHAPIKSALPVLKRGPDDRGVTTLTVPPPSLTLAKSGSGFGAARLNETVTLVGEHLEGGTAVARLSHPRLAAPLTRPATLVDDTTATFLLPDPAAEAGTAAAWPAGVYAIDLVVTRPNQPVWTTNEVTLPLAPSVTVSPNTTGPPPNIPFVLTIDAIPQVRDDQTVFVVFGDRQIAPDAITTPPGNPDAATTVSATASGDAGIHRVRLRVDGVDSIPIKIVNGGFEFDQNQSVKVQ